MAPSKRVPHHELAATLRQRILNRQYPPGGRFPARAEIQAEVGTSMTTVQKALAQLAEDGFVQARGRNGTFVTMRPPHLFRYGIVFPRREGTSGDLFFDSMSLAAPGLEREHSIKVRQYRSVARETGNHEYERLTYDVSAHRLAGLIFASHPGLMEHTPMLDTPGIPRVAVMFSQQFPGVPAIYPDLDGFVLKSVRHLAGQNRKRIAVISYANANTVWVELFQKLIAQHGMETRPYWFQGLEVTSNTPFWSSQITQLLLAGKPEDRPDGLIIADDNLVPHVLEGVVASGVKVPGELGIVAHTNFPYHNGTLVPVTRVGFDASKLLDLCLDILHQEQEGQSPPSFTLVPAVDETQTLWK